MKTPLSEIAVIMAAGLGTRMLPLTEETPKPLLEVNGLPMIESLIKALIKREVSKIFIVVGYKKEQFEYLPLKYSNIELFDNKEYLRKNNISSIKAAESVLGIGNCFICEGDLYVADETLFLCEFNQSCYFGRLVEGYSDDWVFETVNDRIVRVKKGGDSLFNMSGVSYWLENDTKIIIESTSAAYEEENHADLFWDEIVDRELHRMNVGVHPTTQSQIVEIDTVQELIAANKKYRRNQG